MDHAHDTDIREMLDEVSSRMRYFESEGQTKQSCSYEVRHFYNKLFFNPGIYGPRKSSKVEKAEAALSTPDEALKVAAKELMKEQTPTKPEKTKGTIERD